MQNFETDELDSIPTKAKPESSRPTQASSPRPGADNLDSLAVEFGDENLMKREGLELCRADQDRRVRFNILQGDANPGIVNPQGAWVHFVGRGEARDDLSLPCNQR